jgi:hypothetical protein
LRFTSLTGHYATDMHPDVIYIVSCSENGADEGYHYFFSLYGAKVEIEETHGTRPVVGVKKMWR